MPPYVGKSVPLCHVDNAQRRSIRIATRADEIVYVLPPQFGLVLRAQPDVPCPCGRAAEYGQVRAWRRKLCVASGNPMEERLVEREDLEREDLIFVGTCDLSGHLRGKAFPVRATPIATP